MSRSIEHERDEARKALAKAQAELVAARDTLAAKETELAVARALLDDARAELETNIKERDALDRERRHLQRELTEIPKPVPPQPSLRELLVHRGLESDGECTEALQGLLEDASSALIEALSGTPSLRTLLERRLALVCEQFDCQPGPGAVVIHVPPSRCEVCGGSDTRVAFDALLRASRLAGVNRLTIVGGSPNYTTQLREFARGTDLKLEFVAGNRKPGKRRARTPATRVVIWKATILDHGTSAAYDDLGDQRIDVSHRGISGMLHTVADVLKGEVAKSKGAPAIAAKAKARQAKRFQAKSSRRQRNKR